jgi:hypothetical protein
MIRKVCYPPYLINYIYIKCLCSTIWATLFFVTPFYAQIRFDNLTYFDNYTTDNGLISNKIYDCTEIINEKIYFTSEKGIFSFNGSQVEQSSINTQTHNPDFILIENLGKQIITANTTNDLYIFKPENSKNYIHIPLNEKTENASVISIKRNIKNNINIVMNHNALFLLNLSNKLKKINYQRGDEAGSPVINIANEEIVLINSDIYFLDKKGLVKKIAIENKFNYPVKIFKVNNSEILIFRKNRLDLLNIANFSFQKIYCNENIDIITGVNPITSKSGVLGTSHCVYNYSFTGDSLKCNLIASFPLINSTKIIGKKLLIVNTATNGFFISKDIKSEYLHLSEGLGNRLTTVRNIKSHLYVGGQEGLALKVNTQTLTRKKINIEPLYNSGEGRIYDFHPLKESKIGINFEQRFCIYNKDSIESIFPFGVKKIVKFKDYYFFGTNRDFHFSHEDSLANFSIGKEVNGTIKINSKNSKDVSRYSLLPWTKTFDAELADSSSVLISTNKGLYRIYPKLGVLDSLNILLDKTDNSIKRIVKMSNNIFLTETMRGHIYILDLLTSKTRKINFYPAIKHINKIRPLGENTTFVCTNNGLFLIGLNDKKINVSTINYFNQKDGIKTKEVNDIAWDNSSWYILGNNFLTIIRNKNHFLISEKPPRPYLTLLRAPSDSNKNNSYYSEFSNNSCEISLNAFCLFNRGNIVYRYKTTKNKFWQTTYDNKIVVPLMLGQNYITAQCRSPYSTWSEEFIIGPINIIKQKNKHELYSDSVKETLPVFFSSLIIFLILLFFIIYYLRNENNRLKLIALNTNVNPHFFTNFFYDFQYKFSTQDYEEGTKVFSKFSQFLRKIIQRDTKDFVTFEEEAKLIEEYIDLKNQKLDRKINLAIIYYPNDIINQDKIKKTKIPSMIIPALVENSIIHGFTDIQNSPKIEIKAQYIDEQNKSSKTTNSMMRPKFLSIEIIDNGKGIDMNKSEIQEGRGIGKRITFSRIKLLKKIYNINISLKTENYFENNKIGGVKSILRIDNLKSR